MNVTEIIYIKNRTEWRTWLRKNGSVKKEIWLIYYKKNSGKLRIPYNDAVEEALCFGWIDSTVKKIDNEKYVQRFTPRNLNSKWSDLNIARIKKLIQEKKMTKAGLEKIKDLESLINKKPLLKKNILSLPVFFKEALIKNKSAQNNFEKLSPFQKRMYILWITEAKKEETRLKRINKAIALLGQNKKLGMV